MSHRSIGPDARSSHTKASQPAARTLLRSSVRASASNALNSTQNKLTLLGMSSVALVALLYARPDMGHNTVLLKPQASVQADTPAAAAAPVQLAAATPAAAASEAAAASSTPVGKVIEPTQPGSHRQQQAVTSWLSKRYRVAGDAANMLVSTAYVTAKDIKLDPLLILAVMAIESGLNPFAESPVGAKGLMQVMASVHHAKFQAMGGPQTALNPVANIRVGSAILKDYVTRGGSVEAGLKTYVGAGAFDTDAGYGSRVLAEYRKLKLVASGQKVPTFTPQVAPQATAKAPVHQDTAPEHVVAPAPAPEEGLAGI